MNTFSFINKLNAISLTVKANQEWPLFGASSGSQYVVECHLNDYLTGRQVIPTTWEKMAATIAATAESFKTSKSAQIQHLNAGHTLDGLDTIKTESKIYKNFKFLAGGGVAASQERHIRKFKEYQDYSKLAAVHALMADAMKCIKDAEKTSKKIAGPKKHYLDVVSYTEDAHFLTEKKDIAGQCELAWQEIESIPVE